MDVIKSGIEMLDKLNKGGFHLNPKYLDIVTIGIWPPPKIRLLNQHPVPPQKVNIEVLKYPNYAPKLATNLT